MPQHGKHIRFPHRLRCSQNCQQFDNFKNVADFLEFAAKLMWDNSYERNCVDRNKQGGSSRLGWLYRSREEWTTAGLFFERGTED